MLRQAKRLLSLLLVFAMILPLVPFAVFAADVEYEVVEDSPFAPCEGISVEVGKVNDMVNWEYGHDAAVAASMDTNKQIVVTNTSLQGSQYAYSRITITNTSGSEQILSFDYAAAGEYDAEKFTINGVKPASAGGTYNDTIAVDGTVVIEFVGTIYNATTFVGTLTLDGFNLYTASSDAKLTLNYDSSLGSVKVAGAAAANGSEHIVPEGGVELVATAAKNCTFIGWIAEDNRILAQTTTYTFTTDKDQTTVRALFVNSSSPAYFKLNKYLYDDLKKANAAAVSSDNIVLMNNGTLPYVEGGYTIKAGVTLLIPYNANEDVRTTTPETTTYKNSIAKPTIYRMLTMAKDASITVYGAISLSASMSSHMADNGRPSGPCSFIYMNSGSSITLESGANLYAWGYIYGSGSVNAKSGSNVYECFQFTDWRGGSNSSSILAEKKAFPFNQYYVQNIEVPLTLHYGATENIYSGAYVNSQIETMPLKFVGSAKDCLFKLTSGYVVKDYIEESDRLNVDIYGDLALGYMSTTIMSIYPLDTSNFDMPLTNNITVHVHSGTFNIPYDMSMLPGSRLIIDKGAKVTVSSKKDMFVVDADEWLSKGYAYNGQDLIPIKYVASGLKYTRSASDLVDPVIIVKGELEATGTTGYLYTTHDGGGYYHKSMSGVWDVTKQANGTAEEKGWIIKYTEYTHYTFQASGSKTIVPIQGIGVGGYTNDCSGVELIATAAVAPTCTKAGTAAYWTCSVCGTHYSSATPTADNEIANLTTWLATEGQGLIAATGTHVDSDSNGACDMCDTVMHVHSYTGTIRNDSSAKDGTHSFLCANGCGNYGGTVAHTWNGGVVTTEPGCESKGVKTYTCTATGCGATYTEEVAATGHNYTGTIRNDSSAKDGTHSFLCANGCGTYGGAAAHTWNSGVVTTEPGCESKGVKTYTCTTDGCGATYTEEVAATGHNVVLDTTQGESGYTWADDFTTVTAHGKCSKCTYTETKEAAASGQETLKATCVAGGKITYTATFAADVTWANTQTKVVATDKDPNNHDYASVVTPPTCGERGYTTHTCSACGSSKKDTYVDATGKHDLLYQNDSEGHTASCRNCNYVGTKETHSYGTEWTTEKDPTCSETGKKYQLCTVCDYKNVVDIPQAAHSYGNAVVAFAADKLTYTVTVTCTTCTVETKTSEPRSSEHTHNDGNCQTNSSDVYTAKGTFEGVAYESVETVEGAKGGHAYNNGVVTEPTCTAAGFTTYTCTVDGCGHSCTSDPVDALGHDNTVTFTWTDGETVSAVANISCDRCGTTDSQPATVIMTAEFNGNCMTKATKTYKAEYTIGTETYKDEDHVVTGSKNMSAHTVEAEWTQTATTHKKAYNCCNTVVVEEEPHEWNENHICEECGYACQHDWSDWTETQAPTCEDAGSKSRTCSYCRMVETESVKAKGHTEVEIPAVPATCTTDGSTAGVKCSACDTVITAPTTVDALGHDTTKVVAAQKDATCTTTGTTAVMGCTRCDYTEGGAVITKLPHNMTHVAASNATCTEPGNNEFWLCSSCNIYYKNEAGTEAYTEEDKWQIAALDHDFTEKIEDEAHLVSGSGANCQSVKQYFYDCVRCAEIDTTTWNSETYGLHSMDTKWTTKDGEHFHKCLIDGCDHVEDKAACSDVTTDDNHNCDTCGAENVTQHAYTNVVTAPTCTEQGYTTYNCNCGSSYKDDYRDALTHEWEVAAAVWNGTESASVTRTCKRDGCQATETATSTSVKAEVTTQPTYNAKGQTTYTATFNETWASAQKTLTDVPMLEGVAKVISGDTETNYGTLAEAMDNATEGDTIVLLQKYTVTGTETWDLTGKTLRIPTVEGNYGIVVKGDLTIVGGTFDVQAVYGIGVTGKLTVTGGTFNGAKNVSDYIIGNWGTTSITGGEFNGWYCCVNNFDGGELTISGGTFEVTSGDQEIDGIVYESAEILADSGASITGGTFAQEPKADLIATGYCVKTNSDNTASVISHTAGEAEEENRTEPTCTTAGGYDTVVRCTNCNEVLSSETVTLDALTHQWKATDYKWEQAEGKWSCTATRSCGREGCGETETATANVASAEKTAATCTVKGWTTYTASFDVKWADIQTQEKQDIAVIDHTYSEETVSDAAKKSDATCTEAAVYYYSCECGAIGTETFEYGQKLGHSYSSTQTEAPTCTEKGELTYTCSRCSDSYTEPVKETGHSYNAVVTAPTCEKQGYTTHTCSNDGCDDSYVDSYVEETGHDWDAVNYEWSQDKATCTASRTCKNDTSHVEVETATANKIETPPTCTEDGSYYYEAAFTKDWAKTQKTVTYTGDSKTGHSYTWTQTLAPTCTTPGSKSGVCSVCSATTTEAVNVDDNAHSWAEKYSYDQNDHWLVCNNGCETVEKVAHTLGESRTEATFDRNAYTTYTCDCGYSNEVEEENTKLTAVAQIGTQKYENLNEAIIAANASETDVTIELLETVDTAPATFVSAEVTVALGDYHLTWVNANNDLRALKAIAADGFTVQDNKDGTYTFVRATVAEPENGEAAIGNTVYATLAEAIEKAQDGAFINIRADIATKPNATIDENMVIIPNGYALWNADPVKAIEEITDASFKVTTNYGIVFVNQRLDATNSVAKIVRGGVDIEFFATVKEALEAAVEGDTVTMIADSDESQKDMILTPGVILNMGVYNLNARSLVGFDTGYIYGDRYSSEENVGYATLKTKNLLLGETPYLDGNNYVIPIYSTTLDCYIFSNYRLNVSKDTGGYRGLWIYEEDNKIVLKFTQSMSGQVRSLMIAEEYKSALNKYKLVVQLKWPGETGVYEQNCVFNDDIVIGYYDKTYTLYTFNLGGYDTLGLYNDTNLDKLEIKAMVVTESGVTVCSESLDVNDSWE